EEVALAEAALRADAKSRLQATFRPDSSDVRSTLEAGRRSAQAAALTSSDPEERRAVAGWAADLFFEKHLGRAALGRAEYQQVLDQCAAALFEGVLEAQEVISGRRQSTSSSS